MTKPLDAKATKQLQGAICQEIRDHYLDRSRIPGTQVVCETLNALAGAVTVVRLGTGNEPAARAFFDDALSINIEGNSDENLHREHGQDRPREEKTR
jgi:hypothetical protein